MQLIRLALLAFALVFAAPTLARAQGGGPDPLCQSAIDNRAAHGVLGHLYGDSQMRGPALGQFEDGADPLDPAHPLYPFRSIASTANWALEHNGRSERLCYAGNVSATLIAARISAGIIRSGDFVIVEDAGDYVGSTSTYYTFWWQIRQAAAAQGVTVIMMTMFDYCEAGNMACGDAFQYDRARFASANDAGTLNDATRRAALVTATPSTASGSALPGRTLLIDMNYIMDAWRTSAMNLDGVRVIRDDGVHPNVWGQTKWTGVILDAVGWRQYITDVDPLQDLAEANYQALAYGSTTFTGARSRAYITDHLRAR